MSTASPHSWPLRGLTFAAWLFAAGSATFWALHVSGSAAGAAAAMPPAAAAMPPAAAAQAVARLLGAAAATPDSLPATDSTASRFRLTGVIAGRERGLAALIAIDDKPARAFRVGATVDAGLVLQSVTPRRAVLAAGADAPALVTLELPAPKP